MREFCENRFMNDVINKLLGKICEKCSGEIFLSEHDLQFNFTQIAKDIGAEDVIMEFPIRTEELYKNASNSCIKAIKNSYNCKNPDERFSADRTYIDLRFMYDNEEYFVEFKYKLKCPNCYVTRYGKKFPIKTQSANNIGRHQVYEDIERMEHIKKNNNCHSFVVFITNDKGYWETDTMQLRVSTKNIPERSDYNFQLQDGKKINSCKHGLIYLGGIKRKNEFNTDEDKYTRRPIFVSNSYSINWTPFKIISDNDGEFKALVIECRSA